MNGFDDDVVIRFQICIFDILNTAFFHFLPPFYML